MTVAELIAELRRYKGSTEVEIMVGWSTKPIRTLSGDNEEGLYFELGEHQ